MTKHSCNLAVGHMTKNAEKTIFAAAFQAIYSINMYSQMG